MCHPFTWLRLLGVIFLALLCLLPTPAQAAIDSYIAKYLKVTAPIALAIDEQGTTQVFAPEQLAAGKQLFEQNCLNCHVGGSTLSNPTVSLSLADLKGATPPRNTIQALVAYMRQPMTYDGLEDSIWCRRVPASWLAQTDVENLAGFVLRAAQTAPGWGTNRLTDELP
jgi:photosystem II cytochrome c550